MENREQRMARRKPMQVVQVNLRLREALRRKLEAAARQRGVSLNFEMTDRLAKSFDQEEAKALAETLAVRVEAAKSVAEELAEEISVRVAHLLAAEGITTPSPEIGAPQPTINPPAEPAKPKDREGS
jgi:hypothetical protein